jgi:hypothetical protein
VRKLKNQEAAKKKLDRARSLVEKRLQEAKREFEIQAHELKRIESAAVTGETYYHLKNHENKMQMDVFDENDFTFIGEKEEIEYEDFEPDCNFRESNSSKLNNFAIEKFNSVMNRHIFIVRRTSKVRGSFEQRMKYRFHSVISFFLENKCEIFEPNCYDYNMVFGQGRQSNLENLITHATKLISQLNEQCEISSFTSYFFRRGGR